MKRRRDATIMNEIKPCTPHRYTLSRGTFLLAFRHMVMCVCTLAEHKKVGWLTKYLEAILSRLGHKTHLKMISGSE